VTIRRGEPWGDAIESSPDLHVSPGDREAREWVVRQREAGRSVLSLGLAGGDLARTMGGGAPGRFPGTVTRAPVDIVRVEADGHTTWSIAHVVARRSWLRGEVRMAMNAQFFGQYDVAPRSHPNDGRIDVLHVLATMPVRARLQARARARTGTHLPHPQITTTQVSTTNWQFARPLVVWVDGVRWCTTTQVVLTVEPDALIAHA
jgi:hypothetical protein